MKQKILVGLLSVALIAFVVFYCISYEQPGSVIEGGTLVSEQIEV